MTDAIEVINSGSFISDWCDQIRDKSDMKEEGLCWLSVEKDPVEESWWRNYSCPSTRQLVALCPQSECRMQTGSATGT